MQAAVWPVAAAAAAGYVGVESADLGAAALECSRTASQIQLIAQPKWTIQPREEVRVPPRASSSRQGYLVKVVVVKYTLYQAAVLNSPPSGRRLLATNVSSIETTLCEKHKIVRLLRCQSSHTHTHTVRGQSVMKIMAAALTNRALKA